MALPNPMCVSNNFEGGKIAQWIVHLVLEPDVGVWFLTVPPASRDKHRDVDVMCKCTGPAVSTHTHYVYVSPSVWEATQIFMSKLSYEMGNYYSNLFIPELKTYDYLLTSAWEQYWFLRFSQIGASYLAWLTMSFPCHHVHEGDQMKERN